MSHPDPYPVVSEDTLTQAQLADCVVGRARLITRHGNPHGEGLKLLGGNLEEYDRARVRGWALIDRSGYNHRRGRTTIHQLELCWELFCRLTGRPHAWVETSRNLKCDKLEVGVTKGQALSLPAAERLATFVRPFLVARDDLSVTPSGVMVLMHDKGRCQELIVPVLNLVQEMTELQAPGRPGDDFFLFDVRGRRW
jgi:hypothetical protein